MIYILKLSIGFTGTQEGMTSEQKQAVIKMLTQLKEEISEVHHGDCLGADADFHRIAIGLNLPVILHPPIKPDKRAYCSDWVEARPKKDYLVRNKDIVDDSDVLIATPRHPKEELRSGTWATVRYAKRIKKRVVIILPDGKIQST
jgi:hypothetical protein